MLRTSPMMMMTTMTTTTAPTMTTRIKGNVTNGFDCLYGYKHPLNGNDNNDV